MSPLFRLLLLATAPGRGTGHSLLQILAAGGEEPLAEVMSVLHGPQGSAQLMASDLGGNTPLHVAASHGFSEVAELLGGAGADVDARNVRSETALCVASRLQSSAVVEVLVRAGADANSHPPGGYSPLHNCVRNGHAELCQILLEDGQADANIKTSQGQTPLHLAVRSGDPAMARVLIKHGARLNEPNNFGLSPLQMATPAFADILSQVTDGEGGSPAGEVSSGNAAPGGDTKDL
jgi:hypothetical protein